MFGSLPLSALATIVSFADWKTLASWRSTCRTLFKIVGHSLRHRYRTEITPFVVDLPAFDALMRSHGGVISGSAALHFFLPDCSRHPRELDVYIPSNKYRSFIGALTDPTTFSWAPLPGFRQKKHTTALFPSVHRFIGGGVDEWEYEVDDYLLPGKGQRDTSPIHVCPCGRRHHNHLTSSNLRAHSTTYHDIADIEDSTDSICSSSSEEGDGEIYDPNDDDHTDYFIQLEFYTPYFASVVHRKGFATMRSFRTPSRRRVNVIASHSTNPITPLRHFWSTLMINFLTPDACVCAFPSATLERRGLTRVHPLNRRERLAMDRQVERGFSFDESEEQRRELDVWEYIFLGEQRLLSLDFRSSVEDQQALLPVRRTSRGWISNDTWNGSRTGGFAQTSSSQLTLNLNDVTRAQRCTLPALGASERHRTWGTFTSTYHTASPTPCVAILSR